MRKWGLDKEKQDVIPEVLEKSNGKVKNFNSVSVENPFGEIKLFIPETIAVVIALVAVVAGFVLVRIMSAMGLEGIKGLLSEQAYNETAGVLMNINSIYMGIIALPMLILVGFYFYRFISIYPRKNKFIFARIKRTGAIRFSVDRLKDFEVPFDRQVLADKIKVNNPRKHWDEGTGKPVVVLFEGDDCNADLNIIRGNVTEKAKDTNTINDGAFALGRRFERRMQEASKSFMTPTNILLLLMLAGIAVVGFLVLKNPETTAAIFNRGTPALINFFGGF